MAIAKLLNLKLAGIAYERDAVLDALQRTGVVDVTEAPTAVAEIAQDGDLSRARKAVDALTEEVVRRQKKAKKAEPLKPYCDVTYEDFMQILSRESELAAVIESIETMIAERAANAAAKARIAGEIARVEPYLSFDALFCVPHMVKTLILLGTVPTESYRVFAARIGETELATLKCLSVGLVSNAVLVAAHPSIAAETEKACIEAGFARCPYTDELTPKEKLEMLRAEEKHLDDSDAQLSEALYAYKPRLDELKVLADRYAYSSEKARLSVGFDRTAATFTLTAFVPKDAESRVKQEVEKVTEAVYFEFSEPDKDAEVPTLMRNKAVVKPFEFITNMFSPPAYRERDPNLVMGIFFMVFFGFIMADMGYGVILSVGGLTWGLLSRKDSGSRPLKLLIGMGGLFTVVWGALFGSLFGVTVFTPVMPNPETEAPTMLVYCLAAGVVQIMVGFIMKGISSKDQGTVWDGIFDGFVWAVLCVGVLMILPSIGESLFNADMGFTVPDAVTYTGYGIAGGMLLIAVVSAGRHMKGFGKFSKSFGAAYSVINFLSDILSYARLFGLMLSGAIVGRIVTEMSIGMMSGFGGTLGGIFILIIGHSFNLAMNVLGAYVHDARLQYIEYFSRFYTGEGTLFRPIGSNFNYITLKK